MENAEKLMCTKQHVLVQDIFTVHELYLGIYAWVVFRCYVCDVAFVECDELSDWIYLYQCQDVFFLLLLSANFRMVFCNTEQDATVLYSYKLYTSLITLQLRFTLYFYVCLMLITYCM